MKTILIIGMGEFGKHIAKKLHELNNDICIVDIKKDVINALSNTYENAYIGNCMQEQTLLDLGVKNFDICIVAISENFQASLEITSLLKELGAKYIISKASSDVQSKFLRMAGASEVVYPEKDIAEKMAVKCDASNLIDFVKINDEYEITEIHIPKEWTNKTLSELNLRSKFNINIICVKNGDKVEIPGPSYCFKKDDAVFLIGNSKVIAKFYKKSRI
ncbi:MAG: TrkA family potassium uptake protein [Erysipelotrichales bacterium]|nr:TrkA family potassium uptake protein [Erysipelotrichales bacterium]